VDVIPNPDAVLSQANQIVASADSVILDRCQRWFNLAAAVLARVPDADVMDLTV
jgi:hypothetical protein